MEKQKKMTVYDWPTRIFHWLFAVLFLLAYAIIQIFGDDSSLFPLHIMAGLTIGFILILRLIWGLTGTAYARFSSFKFNPDELFRYLKDAVLSKSKRYAGHNPGSSYAALIMFICAAGLVTSGLVMASGSEADFVEEAHELFANLFLLAVITHIGGLILHHMKHRDSLWSSMFDGKKGGLPQETSIKGTQRIAGTLFIVLTLSWAAYLYSQYNPSNQTLDLFGQELIVGEENHESEYEYDTRSYEEDDD